MVCANFPLPTHLDSLKEEAISHLHSLIDETTQPFHILIIDSKNKDSWKSIPALQGFEFHFVNSAHYVLRSGIYQNYSLFGISENCSEISQEDFKNLISLRTSLPFLVLGLSQLEEMSTRHFESLLNQQNSENIIQQTLSRIEGVRGSLNFYHPNDYDGRERGINMETQLMLKEFLRKHMQGKGKKPEKILREAIDLIRPQK